MVSTVIPAPLQVRDKLQPESRKNKPFWTPAPVPDPDPGFAGVTTLRAICETVFIAQSENFSAFRCSNGVKQVNKSRKGRSIKR